MTNGPVPVVHWPATFDKAQDLLIIAVDTPNTPIRDTARRLIRQVLREILGDVELIADPGQPLRLAGYNSRIGISVSHEAGLSLLAVHFAGPVGIDLLRLPESPDWPAEMALLTGDYLGPERAQQIAGLPKDQQWAQFAQTWTEHEARLKCRGLALEEWNPALAAHLSPCRIQQLALPAGYVGTIASLRAIR